MCGSGGGAAVVLWCWCGGSGRKEQCRAGVAKVRGRPTRTPDEHLCFFRVLHRCGEGESGVLLCLADWRLNPMSKIY